MKSPVEASVTPLENQRAGTNRNGITLIEVLIVILSVTMLGQLLVTAVLNSREAARRNRCADNLREMGRGIQLHEAAHGHFPSGGWGCLYVGDPDRGYGKEQPGGWIYNTLPYVGQAELHDLGIGLSGEAKILATQQMLSQALSLFNCPSRRPASATPMEEVELEYINFRPPANVGKSDYAGNAGDLYVEAFDENGAAPSYAEADKSSDDDRKYWIDQSLMTGIFFQRSTIRTQDVTDGLSHTYFVGEKYVHPIPIRITNGGDDQCMYLGFDEDVVRWAKHHDQGPLIPLHDDPNFHTNQGFGSPHLKGCQMLFGDGYVRFLAYDIDADVHCQQANRYDGK